MQVIKKVNNKGFTLTELIVVMAVSSIFLGMVIMILSSSFGLFNKNKDDANLFNDAVIIDNMFTTFTDEVNSNEINLIYNKENKTLYDKDNKYKLEITNEKVNMIIPLRADSLKKEYKDINIDIELINKNSFKVIYKEDEKVFKTTIFNIIGGISYAEI